MKWTAQEHETVRTLLLEGKSCSAIGRQIGRTKNQVVSYVNRTPELKAIGFSQIKERLSGEIDDKIADLLRQNKSIPTICKELGVTAKAVTHHIRSNPDLAELSATRVLTPKTATKYTAEFIAQVAALLVDGKSAGQVGAVVGMTRSAVVSLIFRRPELRELPGRNRSVGFQPGVKPRSSKPREPRPEVVKTITRVAPIVHIDAAEYDANCPRVKLVDHRENQCRWPVGDPRSDDFAYCGHRRTPPSVYCAHHKNRSVQVAFRCEEAA